ncbi:MAG TPA: hypothetical protein VMJ13_00680, partial [Candidatus Acidoferrum sp.]|nr:hypothetical protein [Candidatus Acidoferrum sp.]
LFEVHKSGLAFAARNEMDAYDFSANGGRFPYVIFRVPRRDAWSLCGCGGESKASKCKRHRQFEFAQRFKHSRLAVLLREKGCKRQSQTLTAIYRLVEGIALAGKRRMRAAVFKPRRDRLKFHTDCR